MPNNTLKYWKEHSVWKTLPCQLFYPVSYNKEKKFIEFWSQNYGIPNNNFLGLPESYGSGSIIIPTITFTKEELDIISKYIIS